MMIKICILNKGSIFTWGYNFGYWYFIKYFEKELIEKGYEIKFHQKIDKEFLNSDLIIINSRIYTDTKQFTKIYINSIMIFNFKKII